MRLRALVRLRALHAQREPLMHAEAVLLVDNGKPQVVEFHVLLEQRMRADCNPRLDGGHRSERRGFLPLAQAAGQPVHAHVEHAHPSGELAVMLLGENLRRRHDSHLIAVLHALQRGKGRDHRLAAATSPCSSRCMGYRLRAVALDFRQHAALRQR